MFLLNHLCFHHHPPYLQPLHPIMFLLNQRNSINLLSQLVTFTSHYVPIKSTFEYGRHDSTKHFTSHYVPIKSYTIYSKMYCVLTLHPIMFLLNPPYTLLSNLKSNSFTSHYVPIKSLVDLLTGLLANLYIPLCSY